MDPVAICGLLAIGCVAVVARFALEFIELRRLEREAKKPQTFWDELSGCKMDD